MPRPSKQIPQYVSRRLIGRRLNEIERKEAKHRAQEEYNRRRRERHRADAGRKEWQLEEAEKQKESSGAAYNKQRRHQPQKGDSELGGNFAASNEHEEKGQTRDRSVIVFPSDHPELLTDDPRVDCSPKKDSRIIAAKPEAVPLVTLEWSSIADEVLPYQLIRTPVSIDAEVGRLQILVFCERIFELPKMKGTDAELHNERGIRIKRGSPLISYCSTLLFEAAVAAGGVSSSKLGIALDWAMLLPEDNYLAFRIWLESLENWLYSRLIATPEGRAILAAETARILAKE